MITKIDQHGRIVLPAEVRRKLGWRKGDVLTLRLADSELRISTMNDAIDRAQEIVGRYIVGQDRKSLIDDFIAERRHEAESE